MLRIGLTGGIASGKSHVGALLERAGCSLLDLDRVGHELLTRGGAAHAEVVAAFGPAILAEDGGVDRRALGSIVFSDPAARERLNAIVHPRIRAEEGRLEAGLPRDPAGILVVEAALLVETGQHLRFDRLVVVHCGTDEQRRRLMRRDGLSAEAADARLRSQMEAEAKVRFAHHVVDSAGPLAETERGAMRLADELRAVAAAPPPPMREPLARAPWLARAPAEGLRLAPARLLEGMASGLSLVDLARELGRSGPWHAPVEALDQPPEALAGPVALYSMARRGDDPDYTAAVAYSIGRLTHLRPAEHARAVLSALAVQARVGGRGDRDRAVSLAARFSGVEAEPRDLADAEARAASLALASPPADPATEAAVRRLLQSAAG